MKKRIVGLLYIITFIFILLTIRLVKLQVVDNKEMFEKVVSQRFISARVNNLRGEIYDRNLIPLTDNDEKSCLIIMPQLIDNAEETSKLISENIGLDYNILLRDIKEKKPMSFIIDEEKINIIKNKLPKGISITKTTSRYGENSIARHIIGYTNSDNVGQSGIEKGFDDYLKRNGYQSISVFKDPFNIAIPGLGLRAVETFSNKIKTNVKLTIDYHFQNIIEKAFEKYNYTGAAVLLDVQNGDILAMVSSPTYDQNNVSKYFNSNNKELVNKTLYPYNLGSIFKIIIVEAAFENNTVTEHDIFNCPGYIIVDGQIKKCSKHYGSPAENFDFANAFTVSCNTTFIQTGLKVGYKNIIETARKFGLGQSTGLDAYGFNEDPGFIQYKNYVSNREIANISIGQGELLATPLQVVNIISIVANDGIKRDINIVDSIIDDDGNIVKNLRKTETQNVFPKENIQKIKKMMSQVTKVGTGIKVNMEDFGGAAGKTSSAETGQYVNGSQIVHAWFAGYFPEDKPKYALAIIVENGQYGSQVAAPIFGEVASEIISTGIK